MRNCPALSALFPATRRSLLAATLVQPDKWWYLSELAQHLRTTPSSLQRELSSLVAAGLLQKRREGTRTYFKAETRSPLFPELSRLFEKDSWTDTGIAAGLGTVRRQDYLFHSLRLCGAKRRACPQRRRFAGHRQCRPGRTGARSATSRGAAGQGSECHVLLGPGIPGQGCGGGPFSGGGTARPQAVRERRQA